MQKTVPLTHNHEFRALYSRGKSSARKTMAVYTKKGRQKTVNRLGITVSVKLGGAVVRNRARRRIKEAYRRSEHLFCPGADIVIVARHGILDAEFSRIERELLSIAKELSLLGDDFNG